MSALQIGLAGAVAVIVQTALVWSVSGTAVNVDLPLIVVVLAALARGPLAGLWTGTALGFAQDLLSGGIVGVSGLGKCVVGVAAGVAGERLLVTASWQRSLMLVSATLVHAGCFFGTYAFIPSLAPIGSWRDVAFQGVANALVGGVAIGIAGSLPSRHRQERRGLVGPLGGRWRPKHAP
jgi:rod shape-determining protein MreD